MNKRTYFIDWLRVLSVILLIPFHSSLLFTDWVYHIKNEEKNFGFSIFAFMVVSWIMPLLFFVSGVGQRFSLLHRPMKGFIKERAKRLVIPLIWGILIIVPPQTYFERLQKGQFSGSFFSFYPKIFNGLYPAGNLTWNQLWFLAYLMVFSLVTIPVIRLLKRPNVMISVNKALSYLSTGPRIYLLGLPFAVTEFLLRTKWPGSMNLIADWANFWYFLIIFIYGYLIAGKPDFWAVFERNRKMGLFWGFVLNAATLCCGYFSWITPADPIAYMIWMGVKGFGMWCWIIALLGFAKRYLEFSNRFLQYANEAALPFYILHQTFLIAVGYYVVRLKMFMLTKYLLIIIITFFTTISGYTIIRRFNILRFLFGMRNKQTNNLNESWEPLKQNTSSAIAQPITFH